MQNLKDLWIFGITIMHEVNGLFIQTRVFMADKNLLASFQLENPPKTNDDSDKDLSEDSILYTLSQLNARMTEHTNSM